MIFHPKSNIDLGWWQAQVGQVGWRYKPVINHYIYAKIQRGSFTEIE